MTDPIADMLTRIRNAIAANHTRVDIPGSKLKTEVARILKEEGYINNFTTKEEGGKYVIRVFLRYDQKGVSSITHLSRISRPGRRVRSTPTSQGSRRLWHQHRFDIAWADERKKARQENVGGEILAEV
jgi:small subunit ribosomal protein S8